MTHAGFWKWFLEHEKRLRLIEGDTDRLLQEVCGALGAVREGLGVEVSEEEQGIRDLIITAEGDVSLFEEIKSLVAQAPRLPHWRFIALKPPRGFDFTLDVSGVCIAPSDLVFEALVCNSAPHALGIRVFVPVELVARGGLELVRKVIEIGLGEEMAASSIQHLEIEPEPESTDEFIPLTDLEEYVRWFHERSFPSSVT